MNRSEELCKLLGLSFIRWQGKKTMFPTFDKDDPCTNEYQYFNTEQEAIIFGKSGDKINKPKEKILDLTKPSNFVKLLECISDHLTPYGGVEIDTKGTDYIISIRDMCGNIKAKTFQEGLIVCAIEILNDNELWSDWWDCDEIGDDIRTNFISQAQATKWDY